MAGKSKLLVMSNRQPYRHDRDAEHILLTRPVSGLVSALEPVIKHHHGLWIAQGSGSADAEVLDALCEIQVPPHDPSYRLRRIFLSANEVLGHTDGFSNQALWPLCHIAHQRPVFKTAHWHTYRQVNQTFASAVTEEDINSTTSILVQDYHLALVPGLLRQRLPHARVALFWHVPWPPAEIFARCPWAGEILKGMLGAQLIAFQTEEFCANFLDTCDRILDLKTDTQSREVRALSSVTRVRAVPVGVDPEPFQVHPPESRDAFWRTQFGLSSEYVALSVDRIDFTKGILERLDALELLLEKEPGLVGRLSLVQVAPPCRTGVPAYRELAGRIEERVRLINARFLSRNPAILWIDQPKEWKDLAQLYQAADLCIVSPIHDGMNLVAKEYLWCQHHESGSLVLSQFAGARQQLSEAWLVNPHDTEGFAKILSLAIREPIESRRLRMKALRRKVLSTTANTWGNALLDELALACPA